MGGVPVALVGLALGHCTQIPQLHQPISAHRVEHVQGARGLKLGVRHSQLQAGDLTLVGRGLADLGRHGFGCQVPDQNLLARRQGEHHSGEHVVVAGHGGQLLADVFSGLECTGEPVGPQALQASDVVAGVLIMQLILVHEQLVPAQQRHRGVKAQKRAVLHCCQSLVPRALRLVVGGVPVEVEHCLAGVGPGQSPHARSLVVGDGQSKGSAATCRAAGRGG
mmetsp:Transcript_52062/g.137747  ORF Transcript_52062/g.137747 Transcript_52062/m.137747 type:complete len:222 (-) Transcript_52062:130-795(-)